MVNVCHPFFVSAIRVFRYYLNMFIDGAKIWIKAGNGGNGCLSFRREKYISKGGPDGGHGGKGGDVYFLTAEDVDTLIDFTGRHQLKAGNAKDGEGSNRTGADGEDMIIKVPVGTLIYDTDFDLMLKDMDKPNMKVLVCQGGNGGRGNKSFASSTNQTPRQTTPGKIGQERNIKLELKLIADVGLVGLPNAGKSTLVSRCSSANPKIADYPFTTLEPVLGIVELSDFRRFVMADIPGLIEGAHKGAGLGFDFLKHIERTRIIVHIIDLFPPDNSDPLKNYRKIRNELKSYSRQLADKTEVIVFNKIDLDPESELASKIEKKLGKKGFLISAVTGQGINQLCQVLWQKLKNPDEDK